MIQDLHLLYLLHPLSSQHSHYNNNHFFFLSYRNTFSPSLAVPAQVIPLLVSPLSSLCNSSVLSPCSLFTALPPALPSISPVVCWSLGNDLHLNSYFFLRRWLSCPSQQPLQLQALKQHNQKTKHNNNNNQHFI